MGLEIVNQLPVGRYKKALEFWAIFEDSEFSCFFLLFLVNILEILFLGDMSRIFAVSAMVTIIYKT